MKLSGGQVGAAVGGAAGSIIPGVGTMAGAAAGGAMGGVFDTFQAQKAAKVQRTAGMFGGPRIRPQPKVAPSNPMPNVGAPYLGAPQQAAQPMDALGSGMMSPAPTQGG